MIGMYDEPVAVPIVDLLDSNMMQMYVNAAKGEYERAYNEQKEFAKEFGELYGPNANINKAFYDATRGALSKGMDYLYQNGIDPLRSAEGRAYLAKLRREIPYAEIANLKAQNESMKTYQKYRAEAMRNGTYDPDYEKFVLGGKTLETWDPSKDGMWTREAPSKYSSLKDWTSNLFDNMQLEYDDEATKKAGGMYQIYTKSPKKMQQILDANMKDMAKSDLGRYYLNMYGGDLDALKADIINRNREYTQVDKRADQVKMHLNDQAFRASEAAKQRAFDREQARQEHEWKMEEETNKAAGKENKSTYSYVGDVLNQAQSTLQNYFAVNTFGEKNYGNNLGYILRAQNKAMSNKYFNISNISFNLPRGGYSSWTGANPKKVNETYGYSFTKDEIKHSILTESELRKRGKAFFTKHPYLTTQTDKLYDKGRILGIKPQESSNNGVAIIGIDGKMHIHQKVTVYATDGTYKDKSGAKYVCKDKKWVNTHTNEELDPEDGNDAAIIKGLTKNVYTYTAYHDLPASDVSFTKKSPKYDKDKKKVIGFKDSGKKIPGTEWYDNGGSVAISEGDISRHSSKWKNIDKTYNELYKK